MRIWHLLSVRLRETAPPPEEAEQVDAAVDVVAIAGLSHGLVLGNVDVAQASGGNDALSNHNISFSECPDLFQGGGRPYQEHEWRNGDEGPYDAYLHEVSVRCDYAWGRGEGGAGGAGEVTLALFTMVSSTAGGCCCSVARLRRGDELLMPETLLKTAAMTVKATVPPNGSATAMKDTTVAMWRGKKPTPWRAPAQRTSWSAGVLS